MLGKTKYVSFVWGMDMEDKIKETKQEMNKINKRIKTLIMTHNDVPKELYQRLRKLEEVMEKCKKTN